MSRPKTVKLRGGTITVTGGDPKEGPAPKSAGAKVREEFLLAEQLRVTFRGSVKQMDDAIRRLQGTLDDMVKRRAEMVLMADHAEQRLAELASQLKRTDSDEPDA